MKDATSEYVVKTEDLKSAWEAGFEAQKWKSTILEGCLFCLPALHKWSRRQFFLPFSTLPRFSSLSSFLTFPHKKPRGFLLNDAVLSKYLIIMIQQQ